MKERPILFSGAMVRAILDGSKTQTRRVIKPQPAWEVAGNPEILPLPTSGEFGMFINVILRSCFRSNGARYTAIDGKYDGWCTTPIWKCPYGVAGDRLWVRETHSISGIEKGWKVTYSADDRMIEYPMSYTAWHDVADRLANYKEGSVRPSIYMLRCFSRITLEITNVRVERLQEISESDAIAEGLEKGLFADQYRAVGYALDRDPIPAFTALWDSINGKPRKDGVDISWNANPLVWVVEFVKDQPKEEG